MLMQLLATVQMRVDSGGAVEAAEAGPETQMPRVALLFLTRGAMPHEPAWRAFFHAAGRHTQGAADPRLRLHCSMHCTT
jgi:hypothetical protein